MALVGLNGAGKTTMVKILCGFLEPTEGEILVNGIKRKNISKESYREMITCMFQDSTLLPISLDENITNSVREEMKKEKLLYALEASGFLEKYEKLAEKGDSLLIREVHDKAVEFSGGEKQKLLFARALYKDSPVMILDEPTSALDPISENELYLKFNEVTKGKTVLFISHKFSSTTFCDDIRKTNHLFSYEAVNESELEISGFFDAAGIVDFCDYFLYSSLFQQYFREDSKRFCKGIIDCICSGVVNGPFVTAVDTGGFGLLGGNAETLLNRRTEQQD